ncbi:DUF4870 domain-containing protein [Lapillicoccus sp.]|uniref:DUF4870 domain-containing protein n=1 Tax=Lapillicoccus sp. TaxID=1909287 RepID=UPI002600AA77|nr:DUF4870 domain-containing protein [Lapillicoccus sp.]
MLTVKAIYGVSGWRLDQHHPLPDEARQHLADALVAAATQPLVRLRGTPIITPLAVRLTAGKDDSVIRHHATEALNAQIWFGIVWNRVGLPFYLRYLIGGAHPDVRVFLTVWLAMAGVFVLTAVFSIIGAVRASRREWWRYPLTPWRIVRGARAKSATR